jgi:hypothetical protein
MYSLRMYDTSLLSLSSVTLFHVQIDFEYEQEAAFVYIPHFMTNS